MNRFALTNVLTPTAALTALRPPIMHESPPGSAAFVQFVAKRALAGGTDLLGEIKEGIIAPSGLVNIKTVPEWQGINATGDALHIGATTLIADVAESADVRRHGAAFADAAEHVGSPQIRNQGTVGGNLCQRPRCWYYRHTDTLCLKKGGSTCFAKEGENKYHAIFASDAPCVMVSSTNLGVALLALGGQIHVHSESGERLVKADDFYRLPTTDDSYRETNLLPGEIVGGISLPAGGGHRSAYLQISEKADFDWALVSAAASLALAADGAVADIRLALNAVAPIPWRLTKAEEFLRGKQPDTATLREAATLALSDAKPLAHNAYKVTVAKALVVRVIQRALATPA